MYIDVSDLFDEKPSGDDSVRNGALDESRQQMLNPLRRPRGIQDLLSERSPYRLPPSTPAISELSRAGVSDLIAKVLQVTENPGRMTKVRRAR